MTDFRVPVAGLAEYVGPAIVDDMLAAAEARRPGQNVHHLVRPRLADAVVVLADWLIKDGVGDEEAHQIALDAYRCALAWLDYVHPPLTKEKPA